MQRDHWGLPLRRRALERDAELAAGELVGLRATLGALRDGLLHEYELAIADEVIWRTWLAREGIPSMRAYHTGRAEGAARNAETLRSVCRWAKIPDHEIRAAVLRGAKRAAKLAERGA